MWLSFTKNELKHQLYHWYTRERKWNLVLAGYALKHLPLAICNICQGFTAKNKAVFNELVCSHINKNVTCVCVAHMHVQYTNEGKECE